MAISKTSPFLFSLLSSLLFSLCLSLQVVTQPCADSSPLCITARPVLISSLGGCSYFSRSSSWSPARSSSPTSFVVYFVLGTFCLARPTTNTHAHTADVGNPVFAVIDIIGVVLAASAFISSLWTSKPLSFSFHRYGFTSRHCYSHSLQDPVHIRTLLLHTQVVFEAATSHVREGLFTPTAAQASTGSILGDFGGQV